MVNLECIEMSQPHARIGLPSLTALSHTVACVLSLVMLLSFPAARVHSFGAHFRTPEVRRMAQRQTCVAVESHRGQHNAVRSDPLPKFFAPIETTLSLNSDSSLQSPSEIPLLRQLNRLKLKSRGSRGQDPLLSA
jgi:hypothetical protein